MLQRLLFLYCLLAASAVAAGDVPFAGDFDAPARYNRASARIATSGAPQAEQFAALAAQGLTAVIDLRREQEGTADEAEAAVAAGLEYHALPVGRTLPDEATLAEFDRLLAADPDKPILVYCASGNRAGTLWAMHRIAAGLPVEAAIDEGLAAGMAAERSAWLKAWAAERRGE